MGSPSHVVVSCTCYDMSLSYVNSVSIVVSKLCASVMAYVAVSVLVFKQECDHKHKFACERIIVFI